MSTITRLNKNTRGNRVVVHGDTIYLGGQTATNLEAGIQDQVREAFAKVDSLLALAGSSRQKILSVTLWLKSMEDYAAMNAVWDEWIDSNEPPVRSCARVEMANPRMLFEVIVTAAA